MIPVMAPAHPAATDRAIAHELARAAATQLGARPVVVDFDETLWLRNSTELFLDRARPRWLAFLLLVAVDMFGRLLWFRSEQRRHVYRDWLRLRVITLLMPWTVARWRRDAPTLGPRYANDELLDVLRAHGLDRVGVATTGMAELIEPLLSAFAPQTRLWASGHLGWQGWRIRAVGKLAVLRERQPATPFDTALVITDNDTDLEMQSEVGHFELIKWPKARYRPAFATMYLPFRYTDRGKRSGKRYVWGEVVRTDLAIPLIACAPFAASPLWAVAALVLLMTSLWCVYEIGYFENDLVGRRYEKKGVLSSARNHRLLALSMREPAVWAWALGLGLAGSFCVAHAAPPAAGVQATTVGLLFALWTGWLVLTRLAFALFNRVDEKTRAYVYLPLQVTRSFWPFLFFVVPLAGMAASLAMALSRWIPYMIYRWFGPRWVTPDKLIFLALFLALAVPLAALHGSLIDAGLIAVFTLFLGLRAREQIRDAIANARWLRSAANEDAEPTDGGNVPGEHPKASA